MHWLRASAIVLALPLLGCTSGDSSPAGTLPPGMQPAPTKFDAGAACESANDCGPGLVCLHPATTCDAIAVCVLAPPFPCKTQVACSCLDETVDTCDGYSADSIKQLGPCPNDGGIVPSDASLDSPSAADADSSTGSNDAGHATDASDAASD